MNEKRANPHATVFWAGHVGLGFGAAACVKKPCESRYIPLYPAISRYIPLFSSGGKACEWAHGAKIYGSVLGLPPVSKNPVNPAISRYIPLYPAISRYFLVVAKHVNGHTEQKFTARFWGCRLCQKTL